MQKYGREVIAVDCRVPDDSHAHNIQLDVLAVAPRYLRHEVARLSGVQVVELTSGALISLTVVSLIAYQTIPHSTTRRGVDPCI